MRVIRVIPARRWRHKSGHTASPYGAVPWTRERDKGDWTMETVGWTWENDNGTIGLGRAPAKTCEEAEKVMRAVNARHANRVGGRLAMYAIRDASGHFVAKSHSKTNAHRRTRGQKHFGASVNRTGDEWIHIVSRQHKAIQRWLQAPYKGTGYAPVVYAYVHAPSVGRYAMTRFEYGLLAEASRNGGDLLPSRAREVAHRVSKLVAHGVLRKSQRGYEVTADGWRILNHAEDALRLAYENARWELA